MQSTKYEKSRRVPQTYDRVRVEIGQVPISKRFRFRWVFEPEKRLREDSLKRLGRDVWKVLRNSAHPIPSRGVASEDSRRFQKRVVFLLYDRRGTFPVALSSYVICPTDRGRVYRHECSIHDDRFEASELEPWLLSVPAMFLSLYHVLGRAWLVAAEGAGPGGRSSRLETVGGAFRRQIEEGWKAAGLETAASTQPLEVYPLGLRRLATGLGHVLRRSRRLHRTGSQAGRRIPLSPPRELDDLFRLPKRPLQLPEVEKDARVRTYEPSDNEALLALTRQTAYQSDQVYFYDRSPVYHAICPLIAEDWQVCLAESKDREVIGFFEILYRRGGVAERTFELACLSNAGIHRDYRRSLVILKLMFSTYQEIKNRKTPFVSYLVNAKNIPMIRRVMNPKNLFRPTLFWDVSIHYLFTVPYRRPSRSFIYRQARWDDLPEIVSCLREDADRHLLAPIFTESAVKAQLSRGADLDLKNLYVCCDKSGRVRATCALWDQGPFRRVRMQRYASHFLPLVRFWNTTAGRLGRPKMPLSGEPQPFAFTHLVSHRDGDERALANLLLYLSSPRRRWPWLYLVLALCEEDPLQGHLSGMLRFSSPMKYFLCGLNAEAIELLSQERHKLPQVNFATL